MNTPNTTDITDDQVKDLITQFDTNMFPKESAAFSVAPDRDGHAQLGPRTDRAATTPAPATRS